MSVNEIFFLFQINRKNMPNAALFDATQKTPEKKPYRAAISFNKKKYVLLHFKAVIKW